MNQAKIINVIFILAISLGSQSCKTQNLQPDEILISLEKTSCFGTCPSYVMSIYSTGVVKFKGLSNHEMIGDYSASVTSEALTDIVSKFRNSNFFSFQDLYTSKMSDLPTTYLTFRDQGKEKKIQDYDNAPAQLKELEGLVEDLIVSLKWKKIN